MKSQGLPINFLVKFILAFVVFGLGIVFLWSIYEQGRDMAIDPSQHIRALNCPPTQPICVGASTVSLRGGESALVDVRIFNNRDIDVEYTGASVVIDFEEGGSSTLVVSPMNAPGFTVGPRSSYRLSFLVTAERTTLKGAYSVRIAIGVPTGSNHPQLVERINVNVR